MNKKPYIILFTLFLFICCVTPPNQNLEESKNAKEFLSRSIDNWLDVRFNEDTLSIYQLKKTEILKINSQIELQEFFNQYFVKSESDLKVWNIISFLNNIKKSNYITSENLTESQFLNLVKQILYDY